MRAGASGCEGFESPGETWAGGDPRPVRSGSIAVLIAGNPGTGKQPQGCGEVEAVVRRHLLDRATLVEHAGKLGAVHVDPSASDEVQAV